jgi:hypothetical protein
MWSEVSPLTKPVNMPTRNSPVSRALQVPKSALGDRIRRALDVLDAVHDDGQLTEIPLKFTATIKSDGAYRTDFDTQSGMLVGKQLDISRLADSPEFALFHEVGHMLDHQIWGGGIELGSEMDMPELQLWHTAIVRSRAFAYMVNMRRTQTATIFTEDNQSYALKLDPHELRAVDYLLKRSELLARSYSQYIMTRSNAPALIAVLDKVREKLPNRIYFAIQWSDDDFEPIAEAFDGIFRARGWR